MRKNYYRVIKFYGDAGRTDTVWHCSHEVATSLPCDVIIPLTRKPAVGTFDYIREG